MDDLISRQAAIDAVEKECQVDGAYGYMDTKSIIDMLADLPSAEFKLQWIPVRQRLPENDDTVLITHRGGTSFGWYNGRYWERGASTNHRSLKTVTAWMPLPERYKDEE